MSDINICIIKWTMGRLWSAEKENSAWSVLSVWFWLNLFFYEKLTKIIFVTVNFV
jgi:hypothetical protein